MRAIAVATVLLLGLIFAVAEARGPAPPFVAQEDPFAATMQDSIVIDPGGGERVAGHIMVVADGSFQTVTLTQVARNVELISEDREISRLGIRIILIRVPESEYERALAATRRLRGVVEASGNGILRPGAVGTTD